MSDFQSIAFAIFIIGVVLADALTRTAAMWKGKEAEVFDKQTATFGDDRDFLIPDTPTRRRTRPPLPTYPTGRRPINEA